MAGSGVNVILDMVAGSYVAHEIECLAEHGRLVVIAVQCDMTAEVNASMLLRRCLTVTGSKLQQTPVSFHATIAQALRANGWPLLAHGSVKPVTVFDAAGDSSCSGASQTHVLMDSSHHIGKIVWTRT